MRAPFSGTRVTRAYRSLLMLIGTVTFGFNYVAWSLVRPVGQDPWHFLDVDLRIDVLLIFVPAVLGALGRIPVGALTDRFGPRIMFPAVTVCAALAVLALAAANSGRTAMAAALALGVAGTAFPIGTSLAASLYPLGRRGFVLSVYGAGIGGAAAGNLASLRAVRDHGTAGLVALAGALMGCAALTAIVVRVPPVSAAQRRQYPLRSALALMRLPATRHLSAWYALTAGGLASFGLCLPSYLHGAYDVGWAPGLSSTAVAVAVAAVACPVGGWLCERQGPAGVLGVSYAAVALLALLLTLGPPFAVAIVLVPAIAAGLGMAAGVILALIGRTAPAGRMGIISGTVGAAGGLAALLGPVLLGIAFQRTGSFNIGWALLAGLALAAAAHIRGQHGCIGAALAFPAPPPARGHATTVVSLGSADAARNTEGVVAALTALATPGDLVIVYGDPDPEHAGLTPYGIVSGLRAQLPGRTVLALYLNGGGAGWSSLIAEVLDEGGVVLGYTPHADLSGIAARLAERLGAHQVLRLTDRTIESVRPFSLPWLVHPALSVGKSAPRPASDAA